MKKLLSASIIIVSIASCTKHGEHVSSAQPDSIASNTLAVNDTSATYIDSLFVLDTYLEQKEIIDTAQVTTIDYDCAIIVEPTQQQLDQMKDEYGEEDFFAVVDDANFYQSSALALVDSMKIKTVTATKRYVKFIGSKNQWLLNLKRKGLPEWNIVFFNREKEPMIISATELTTEKIAHYFR